MTHLVAVDTSVAIPLLVATHTEHAGVSVWADGVRLALSGHALIETYSVLTRLPGDSRVAPKDALQLLEDNFAPALTLTAEMQRSAPELLARLGIAGGATYDGFVALAAHTANVPLATRDARARSTYEVLGVDIVVPFATPDVR